jgi:hypothetical protein
MESISKYAKQKEYIITLYRLEDLDEFYNDMETPGGDLYIPDREVGCVDRRPVSRSTHYMLTDWEAQDLKGDSRIRSLDLHPRYLGIKAGTYETQTSSNWNKSGSTSNVMKNWGLLRCYEETNRSGWGSNGTPDQTGTINLNATGRNVDVVIIDENGIVWNHPEYALNADGTGGTRTNQYNWEQHNLAVKGTAPGNYAYGTGSHSTHVAGTVSGNTQGWARNANIYNIYYLAGDGADYNFPYVMDYVREFHRTKSVNVSTGRKNPTITNNSWGMSIFPGDWSFGDITAVTYRGTRYTPGGSTSFTGYSGVCTSNARLATLVEFENAGNRITTTGLYTPPSGAILTKPASWSQTGQQATLTVFAAPDASYELTVQGPADIDLINNVAVDSISGSMSITSDITVRQGATVVQTYTDGPYSTTNGGTIETNIRPTRLSLPNNAVYTVTFGTTLDVAGAGGLTYATTMSLTVVTESTPATANVSSLSTNLLGAASLTSSTTPTSGSNDDGFWTLALPFNISFLGTTYSTIYVGTNHYVTFGSGSTNYSSLGPTNPNLPKIMWSCADNSVQRIYYGTEGAGSGTYTVTNSGASAYTINSASNPTLTLERGGTYTFNVSASGHPFWIQTVSGAYSSGNIYNTGVTSNGTQSGTITFTVPNDAPSTLYYVCQFHSSMRGTINIVTGTRTYRVRVEGAASTGGTVGSPTMVNEYVFYEATPTQIDLQLGVNGRKTTGAFTNEQLTSWGFVANARIPKRVNALDSDIELAIDEGIIYVGAAGNGYWKHDVPGGQDWNNTFEMANRYPDSVTSPYYYMRGSSPTANDNTVHPDGNYDLPNICVGSIDVTTGDYKAQYSDCGPGVDIFAPGTNIISSYTGGISDSRGGGLIGKLSGTSMASPQVCGVLACALETNPHWKQEQAKAYITGISKPNQITDTSGGPTDYRDLQGAPDKYLFYRKERADTGTMVPKIAQGARPATGALWPRPRIYRFK